MKSNCFIQYDSDRPDEVKTLLLQCFKFKFKLPTLIMKDKLGTSG